MRAVRIGVAAAGMAMVMARCGGCGDDDHTPVSQERRVTPASYAGVGDGCVDDSSSSSWGCGVGVAFQEGIAVDCLSTIRQADRVLACAVRGADVINH
jgi:hypothetical protein